MADFKKIETGKSEAPEALDLDAEGKTRQAAPAAAEKPKRPAPAAETLDLNALFGLLRPLKVLWEKGEYELLRPEAFGPRETVRMVALQRKAWMLQSAEDIDAKQSTELGAIVDEMLTLICKRLPVARMPFTAKLQVVSFYALETQRKNILKAALRQIGATPSAS